MPSVLPNWPPKPVPGGFGKKGGKSAPLRKMFLTRPPASPLNQYRPNTPRRLAAVVVGGLEFLAQLLVVVAGVHVGQLRRQRVEVDRGFGVGLAPGADRLEASSCRSAASCSDERGAADGGRVVRVQAAAHVVAIRERRAVGHGRIEPVGGQHLRAAHAGRVDWCSPVRAWQSKTSPIREHAERAARIALVSLSLTSTPVQQVLAETVAAQAGRGQAHAHGRSPSGPPTAALKSAWP